MSENTKVKKRGFFAEMVYSNPVFGLYLGICSALAVTTSINNALGMGVCVIVVLVMSNIIISLIAKITPDDIHIPVYIVIIATLVTVVSMLLEAYTPELFSALGAFVDLIVVNCIILGRAEAYACNHNVAESAKDGIMMGLAYTFSLLAMSLIRQILGTGILSLTNPMTNETIFSIRLIPAGFEIPVFTSQTGAFLTFAILAALVTAYKNHNDAKEAEAAKTAVKGAK
ncbi:MAG: electron transport complex subunit RsxE [Solobacterium sp.]|jgi:electron transport complex protein RnfE|nr:electron transport complex subunit RsxE [Solobacterium sp.]MCH4222023.1 electron transport complex subunit RsxE [Solobacterium sp.]